MLDPLFTPEIPLDQMETVAFAFICHWSDWITWPRFQSQFAEYKGMYFGTKSWILKPIKPAALARLDRNDPDQRRQWAVVAMLMSLQNNQNRDRYYWNQMNRSTLNRHYRDIYHSFYHMDKTAHEVNTVREKYVTESHLVVADALTNLKYTELPVPKMVSDFCRHSTNNPDDVGLLTLSDEMEAAGLEAEAEHFRSGIHTWCCPVLRKLARS